MTKTYFIDPTNDLNKSGVRRGHIDGIASSLGASDPFDDVDKQELQTLHDSTNGAYGITVGKTAISVCCNGESVAEVGLPTAPMTLSDLRNAFKEAVSMAKEHAKENRGKMKRKEGIEVTESDLEGPKGEAKGAEGEQVVGNADQKEEFEAANGDEAEKSFNVDEAFFGDLVKKTDGPVNQGYRKMVMDHIKISNEEYEKNSGMKPDVPTPEQREKTKKLLNQDVGSKPNSSSSSMAPGTKKNVLKGKKKEEK